MDIERRLEAAIAQDHEAALLFAWLAPAHKAAFFEYLHAQAPDGVEDGLAEVVEILAGRQQAM